MFLSYQWGYYTLPFAMDSRSSFMKDGSALRGLPICLILVRSRSFFVENVQNFFQVAL